MVVYNFFHLETSSSTVCQRMALAVLAYFPLEYLGWKFWTTFQQVAFISEMFQSIELKLSYNTYTLTEITAIFG